MALGTVLVLLRLKKVPEPALIALAAGLGLVFFPGGRVAAAEAGMQHAPELVQTIPLPGVRGRIDHLDIDQAGGRLFVAALGNDSIEVVDLRSGRRTSRLNRLKAPQGVAYVPAARRLYVANAGGGIDVFAGDALSPAGRITGLNDADNIRADHANGLLYVGYGEAIAVVEAPTAQLAKRIGLAGHPESFQLETAGKRIFVNIPTARQVAVVDRGMGAVVASWELGEAHANFPMALDEPRHRLFIGARSPATLVVLDTDSGKQVAAVPICGDTDDVFTDTVRARVLAICGDGVLSVIQQEVGDSYREIGRIKTAPGARTGFWSATERMLYIAAPARGRQAARILVYRLK